MSGIGAVPLSLSHALISLFSALAEFVLITTETFKSIDDSNIDGEIMIKVYGALSLLIILAAASGQDYLEGGYVRSGDYGDIGKYFRDPIFYSPSSHYISSDPAISQMQRSMDRYAETAELGSLARKTSTHKATTVGKAATRTAAANMAGRWHLELSEGRSIDLDLYQLGGRIFGQGGIGSGMTYQPVSASGSISGNSMILDIVASSGTELYEISLDVSRLHLASPYTMFRAEGKTATGTVRAFRMAPGVEAK